MARKDYLQIIRPIEGYSRDCALFVVVVVIVVVLLLLGASTSGEVTWPLRRPTSDVRRHARRALLPSVLCTNRRGHKNSHGLQFALID